jgi:hypothetical protein
MKHQVAQQCRNLRTAGAFLLFVLAFTSTGIRPAEAGAEDSAIGITNPAAISVSGPVLKAPHGAGGCFGIAGRQSRIHLTASDRKYLSEARRQRDEHQLPEAELSFRNATYGYLWESSIPDEEGIEAAEEYRDLLKAMNRNADAEAVEDRLGAWRTVRRFVPISR